MKYKLAAWSKWIFFGAFVLIAGFCYSRDSESTKEGLSPELVMEESSAQKEETVPVESFPAESQPFLYVHVCGQVISPGVYCMEQGQRIYQAIEMAGGFAEEAEETFLNLAQPVEDGMQIYVPKRGEKSTEVPFNGTSASVSSKVNLNTASKENLMTLQGIGEAKAEAIIRFREERGGFSKIEEIMEISGIKETAFQKIKDDIMV